MFQEKERVEYSSYKAPEELKNRIWSSIEQDKRKHRLQAKKCLAMAACFVGILLVGNFIHQESPVLMINDAPALVSEGRNKSIQEMIPLELQVSEKAHIKVSAGKLTMDVEGYEEAKEVTEMEVLKNSVVYWCIENDISNALCTVITEDKEYQYVLNKVEDGWKVQLKNTK